MPTAAEHQQRAEHHLAFLETIDTEEFCDWAGVVAFYVAVHLVERLRALVGQHSGDHGDRLDYIRDNHPAILAYFDALFDISLIARYRASSLPWLPPKTMRGYLYEIQRYVRDVAPTP